MFQELTHKQTKPVIIAAVITVVICLPLLFIHWDSPNQSRSLNALWNLGHLPLFACIILLLQNFSKRYSAISYEGQLLIAISLAVGIGLIIEVLQHYLGREFSFYDVYIDVLGASFTVIWFPKTNTFQNRISPYLFKLVSVIAILFSFIPLVLDLTDEFLARDQFPVLANFQLPLELNRFSGNAQLIMRNGELEVQFGTEQYSGFVLQYFPRNWSGYKSVNLNIENTNQENIIMSCRIHDFLHNNLHNDRFNQRFIIKPGSQIINIDLDEVKSAPHSRSMDMTNISELGCFTIGLISPISLNLKQIVLN